VNYDCHVFVCANQKAEGKKCCGEEFGMEAVTFLRDKIRNQQTKRKIRIQRAGCLDLCSKGPALVVYPEGIFYHYQNQDDLAVIAENHLLQNRRVEALLISE
jgi:(2Fe-2S) ferredoxin